MRLNASLLIFLRPWLLVRRYGALSTSKGVKIGQKNQSSNEVAWRRPEDSRYPERAELVKRKEGVAR